MGGAFRGGCMMISSGAFTIEVCHDERVVPRSVCDVSQPARVARVHTPCMLRHAVRRRCDRPVDRLRDCVLFLPSAEDRLPHLSLAAPPGCRVVASRALGYNARPKTFDDERTMTMALERTLIIFKPDAVQRGLCG